MLADPSNIVLLPVAAHSKCCPYMCYATLSLFAAIHMATLQLLSPKVTEIDQHRAAHKASVFIREELNTGNSLTVQPN